MKRTSKYLSIATACILTWWLCRRLAFHAGAQTAGSPSVEHEQYRVVFHYLWLPWSWIPRGLLESWGMTDMAGLPRFASFFGILWATIVGVGLLWLLERRRSSDHVSTIKA
jgi:hypothetical protein